MLKSVVFVALLALICVVASEVIRSDKPLSDKEVKDLFIKFLHKYEKVYSLSESEYKNRFDIFKRNVEKARYLNELHKDSIYGVTKFMDLEEFEFKRMYLSRVPMNRPESLHKNGQFVERVNVTDIPTEFDWRSKNAITRVKNQGMCGSCWAFSAVGNMESIWHLAGNDLVELSEQNLVDCDHNCDPKDPQSCDAGCNGGLMWNAFQYVIDNGGIESEDAYPYEGRDDTCKFQKEKIVAKFSSYKMLPTDEEQMAAWLVANGPISVALNAEWLQFYIGGVSHPLMCDKKALDHGVMIVGYGVDKGVFGQKPYWIVKNSWGASWGEHGYFRMYRGDNTCGIADVPCSIAV